MKPRSRRTIVVTAAGLALAAGAGGALAAGAGSGPGPGGAPGPGVGIVVSEPGDGPDAIAEYLGLTGSELRAQLEAGKSLAQIAAAQGKSVDGLEDVILADAKTRLDQAVANGKLTAAQEQKMLDDLKANIDDIVNGTGKGPGVRVAVGPPFGTAAASYLGLTEDELRAQLESGKTLAQVAAVQDKSLDGLKAAILAGAEDQLDQAVAAGKLTADQEQTMLADLKAHIDDIVNNAGPFSAHKAGPVSVTA